MFCAGLQRSRLLFSLNPLSALENRRKAMSTPIDTVCPELNAVERALTQPVLDAHQAAVDKGSSTYKDPNSGLTVFTRQAHIARGLCCGSRCRHCPFNHVKVPTDRKPQVAQAKSAVYTRTGDRGTSSLFTGERRSKSDLVFEGLGAVDELNSFIGVAKESLRHEGKNCKLIDEVEEIQQHLLDVGTAIASPVSPDRDAAPQYNFVGWISELEKRIDAMDSSLPPLGSFILPGGGMPSAHFHVCRSVCRRAERQIVALNQAYPTQYTSQLADACRFVNRLSDYFFLVARFCSERGDVHRIATS